MEKKYIVSLATRMFALVMGVALTTNAAAAFTFTPLTYQSTYGQPYVATPVQNNVTYSNQAYIDPYTTGYLPTTTQFGGSFSDVGIGSPREKAISFLANAGIISGYGDGTFKPTKVITRAEMLKLLVVSDPAVSQGEVINFFYANYASRGFSYAQFKDVDVGMWYAPYVAYAYSRGWAAGYPDGSFRPNQAVNLAEALKMTFSFLNIQPQTDTAKYLIGTNTSNWYNYYMFTAIEKKIFTAPELNSMSVSFMDNASQTLTPSTPISRENVAEILYRSLMVKQSNAICYSSDTAENWKTYSDPSLNFQIQMPFDNMNVVYGNSLKWNSTIASPTGIATREEVKFFARGQTNTTATPAYTVMKYTVQDANMTLQSFSKLLETSDGNANNAKRVYQYTSQTTSQIRYTSRSVNSFQQLTSHGMIVKNGNSFYHIFSLDWYGPCAFDKVLDSFSADVAYNNFYGNANPYYGNTSYTNTNMNTNYMNANQTIF